MSLYDPEIAEEICLSLMETSKGLRPLLDSRPDLPAYDVVARWLNSNAEFQADMARAREYQADFMGDELIEIADDPKLEPHDKRIRVDTRKWLMSKRKAKVYGDKIDVTSAGESIAAPAPPPVVIDARVQTIIMLAAGRREAEEEARKLLED